MSSFEAYPGALDKLHRMAATERAQDWFKLTNVPQAVIKYHKGDFVALSLEKAEQRISDGDAVMVQVID